jgi:hypothetical protein
MTTIELQRVLTSAHFYISSPYGRRYECAHCGEGIMHDIHAPVAIDGMKWGKPLTTPVESK